MLERKDQLELLALIEGELGAAEVAALRARLAHESRVLAIVDRMREDRANLRSVPEATLPRDFLIDLEPYLARPMLIEAAESALPERLAKPGEFRRQHRRQTRRIRWSRLAAAATILLALIAGMWAAINGLVLPRLGDRDLVAVNGSAPPADSLTASEPLPLQGTIHHYLPNVAAVDVNKIRTAATPSARLSVEGQMVAADFAVVIHSGDPAATEALLVDAASEVHSNIALVRNFSYAEAQQLANELRLTEGLRPRRTSPPMMASADNHPGEIKELADGVRQQLNVSLGRPHVASIDSSGQLAGMKEQAPSLEQQLEFSSRGATHTLALPASELRLFVEELALADGQVTSLRMLQRRDLATTRGDSSIAEPPLLLWLSELPQVRASMARLSQLPPDTTVLVPVIVQK